MHSLDLSQHKKPEPVTSAELALKLNRLGVVLEQKKMNGILFVQEGAMRWLTGLRHQIIDIAPDAESPVQALVLRKGNGWDITFITTRIEMPRVKDQVPPLFDRLSGVSVKCGEHRPDVSSLVVLPHSQSYTEIVGDIVRPLLGGFSGNQFAKLEWLSCMTSAILAGVAHRLEPELNGSQVRGMIYEQMSLYDIENNLIFVALEGQETFFHPLHNSRYKVGRGNWIKLVVGSRYAEMIVSASIMVKFGGIPEPAKIQYTALQHAAAEYADCYRAGAIEKDIFVAVGRRFGIAGKRTGFPEIEQSAYAHHLGGPTSPLGNRDYLIEEGGNRRMFPWMQFAINPVEILSSTKVEIQGIVTEDGPPLMLDSSKFTPAHLQKYSKVTSSEGTVANVADIIER
jgi:hypothetical protein